MSRSVALGILLPMAGRGLDASRLLAELTEEVQAAEAAGLDLVLVPEHHAGPPGSLTAPLTVAAWMLARTSTIRIGTGVLVLPLHSTVHVAEAAALLQLASGNRFVLGVGAGYQATDFDLFGVDRRRRTSLLEQGLRDLRASWTAGSAADTTVRPSLAGRVPPPLWLGAWSAAGVRRAATCADGWIADPIRSVTEVEAIAAEYRRSFSGGAGAGHVVVMREGWVGATGEEARAVYGPAVQAVYRYYLRNGAFPADSGITEDDLTLDGALAERVVVGSPVEMADQLASLVVRTGAETVVLALRHPSGPAHDAVLAAIQRLGREVRSQLQRRLGSTEATT